MNNLFKILIAGWFYSQIAVGVIAAATICIWFAGGF